jgi:hypothetical protein
VPASAHSLSAAGGTPGRLVAAVMPLLIWPVAVFVRHAWRNRTLAALIALLAVISLDNAISYNLGHVKSYGPLRDWSATGWKINQMFPAIRGDVWETSWWNFGVLIVLIVAMAGLAIWMVRRAEEPQLHFEQPRRALDPRAAAMVVAGFIAAATTATAAIGQWTRGDYLPRPGMALMSAADALAPRDSCRDCLSSGRASVQWRDLQPAVDRFRIETNTDGAALVVQVILETDTGRVGLARVRCEFGDGGESPWIAVLDRRELQHRYSRPGRYELVTWVEWGSGGHRVERRTIEIAAGAGARPSF